MAGGYSAASFLGTLLATLIGVVIGFRLDRYAESRNQRNTTVQHLRAIKSELEDNRNILSNNYEIIDYLQEEGNSGTHYALTICSMTAWESAQNGEIVEHVDEDLYSDIQELYSDYTAINESIKRLRTELLHPDLLDSGEKSDIFPDTWTVEVARWDSERERVETTGLGDLIKSKSNRAKISTDGLIEKIDEEIQRIQSRI